MSFLRLSVVFFVTQMAFSAPFSVVRRTFEEPLNACPFLLHTSFIRYLEGLSQNALHADREALLRQQRASRTLRLTESLDHTNFTGTIDSRRYPKHSDVYRSLNGKVFISREKLDGRNNFPAAAHDMPQELFAVDRSNVAALELLSLLELQHRSAQEKFVDTTMLRLVLEQGDTLEIFFSPKESTKSLKDDLMGALLVARDELVAMYRRDPWGTVAAVQLFSFRAGNPYLGAADREAGDLLAVNINTLQNQGVVARASNPAPVHIYAVSFAEDPTEEGSILLTHSKSDWARMIRNGLHFWQQK